MNDLIKALEGITKPQPPKDMLLYDQRFIPEGTRLNFEKRVLNPSQYPVLDLGDGSVATHKMAWGGGDGKFQAFPTVVQDGDQLRELGMDEAWQHAVKTGEFREFATAKEAEDYARGGYKKQWGAGEPQVSLIEKLGQLIKGK